MVYLIVFSDGTSRKCKRIGDNFVDMNNSASIIKCNHCLIRSVTALEKKHVPARFPER